MRFRVFALRLCASGDPPWKVRAAFPPRVAPANANARLYPRIGLRPRAAEAKGGLARRAWLKPPCNARLRQALVKRISGSVERLAEVMGAINDELEARAPPVSLQPRTPLTNSHHAPPAVHPPARA